MIRSLPRSNAPDLAYALRAGDGPTLVFLPGYASDMSGSKALALAAWAAAQGHAMLRLDYRGCGASAGDFSTATLAQWRDDVLDAIDQLTSGPLLLIGSSMGGWLMLLVAQARAARVAGLIGIAAAPDFTHWGFSDAEKAELAKFGRLERPSDYGPEPMLTTLDFWRSGETLRLLDAEIALDCPVRLLHGQADRDVPFEISLTLATRLRSADVQTILVKDGDHRLSHAADLDLLLRVTASLLETL